MKKAFLLMFLLTVFLLLSSGCAKSYDMCIKNNKGKLISLGESRAEIEKKIGEAVTERDRGKGMFCEYGEDSNLYFIYNSNDDAVSIVCHGKEYSVLNGISVGDEMSEVTKKLGKTAEFLHSKTLYFEFDGKNYTPISFDDLQTIGKKNIYIIDFGPDMSSGVVDEIIISGYEVALYGVVD